MSLQFNDTSTYKGIVQIAEKEMGMERGFISGNTNRLKEFTADVNLAWDDYVYIALKSSGYWQFDDSNYNSHYPIIYTDIVAGQRDYTFTTDEDGALILDIYKVMVKRDASVTEYDEIFPLDQQRVEAYDVDDDIAQEVDTQGTPFRYDKTANGIFLDPIPSYNATNGLKVYINREPSYFIHTDTSKKPGCPGIHHRYFALKPALDYARRHNLTNYNLIREEVVSFEGDEEKGVRGSIERYFSRREKDVSVALTPSPINYE